MRRLRICLSLVVLMLLGTPAVAFAQETRQAQPVTIAYTYDTAATKTTLTLKFPSVAGAQGMVFKKSVDSVLHPQGEADMNSMAYDGDVRCGQSYGWSDANGYFTYQHGCGTTTAPWGFKISATVQSIITSLVAEAGMEW